MNFLKGLSLLVLGLGDSGLAMARWARRCGAARIVVADTRSAPPQAAQLALDVPEAELHCGPFEPGLLEGIQLILKSPGLAPRDAQLAPLLAQAAERGIQVRGELTLFAAALAELKAGRGYAPAVLAITGTNGKTTTTSLTALLLERAGRRVAMAGNIGPTMLDTLGAALDLEPAVSDDEGGDGAAAAATVAGHPSSAPDGAPAADDPGHEPGEDLDAERHELAALDGIDPDAVVPAEGPGAADGAPAVDAAGTAETALSAVTDPAADAGAPPVADDEAVDIGGGPPPHLIPPPPPGPVFAHLPEAWVLELSSFQLDGVTNFEATAATVLNLSQDHLDWHGSMAEYAAAKACIFGPPEGAQTVLVINRDDAHVEALVPQPAAPAAAAKGKSRVAPRVVARRVVRFGLGAPARPGDFGLLQEGGITWLVRAMESDDAGVRRPRRKAGAALAEAEEIEDLHLQRLMPADALRIRGRHNAANALAALALATAAGAPLAPMLHGLREYRGEPHRVEFIGMVAGLEAYDDSKGTNVGATVAALNGLGAEKAPARLLLILGGDGKGQDFGPLAEPLARHARAVALIGRDAVVLDEVLRPALQAAGAPVTLARHDSLEAATRWAIERGHPGDALLLSPACASLDMFRNYAHRAEVFCSTVQQVATERGEVLA